ncbi:hypothetical protein HDU96_009812 [Phlyctochytrium bullatum]|nr:hypothetical protein HDU96_009812 [Phlyctochytrium bullatum]
MAAWLLSTLPDVNAQGQGQCECYCSGVMIGFSTAPTCTDAACQSIINPSDPRCGLGLVTSKFLLDPTAPYTSYTLPVGVVIGICVAVLLAAAAALVLAIVLWRRTLARRRETAKLIEDEERRIAERARVEAFHHAQMAWEPKMYQAGLGQGQVEVDAGAASEYTSKTSISAFVGRAYPPPPPEAPEAPADALR